MIYYKYNHFIDENYEIAELLLAYCLFMDHNLIPFPITITGNKTDKKLCQAIINRCDKNNLEDLYYLVKIKVFGEISLIIAGIYYKYPYADFFFLIGPIAKKIFIII